MTPYHDPRGAAWEEPSDRLAEGRHSVDIAVITSNIAEAVNPRGELPDEEAGLVRSKN